MNALQRGIFAVGLLAACHAVDAFGPRTHLWIGSEILGDLRAQCGVRVDSRVYRVEPELCRAITANPESFYAGVLGPDIYPDLVSGQNTTHSGVKGGWQTADFLEHVVASANTPSSRAYAAGFLVHAAGDVFGHSYVNTYAGDTWNLSDERLVELRHAVIEKYIDAHLPAFDRGATAFRAPAEFVRDTLIHNASTQPQYRRAAFAGHLASMTSVKAAIDDLAERSDAIVGIIPDLLGKYAEFQVTLAAQLVDGEVALAAASAALEAPKAAAAAQRAILAGAGKAVADAARALSQHDSRMTDLTEEAQAQQQAAAAASNAAQQAAAAANEIRSQLSGLEARIRTVPPKIVVKVCHDVTEQVCATLCPEGSSNTVCREVCNVPRQVCNAVERINDEYQKLNDQITIAKHRLGDLESRAADETAKAQAASANAEALREEQAAEAATEPDLAAAQTAAAASYAAADAQYRSLETAVATLQQRADALRGKAEAARKNLVDAKAVADQLRNLASQLNVLSLLFRNWEAGIDHAGSAFVATSDRIARGLLVGRMHLFSEYRRWLACDGAVYLAEPYQVADVPCGAETALQRLAVLMRDLAPGVLPGPLKAINDRLDDLRVRIDTELRRAIVGATAQLVRFASDRSSADFVDLLANPDHATRARLDDVLARRDDARGKNVLVFDHGADLIDRDIGLAHGTLDPNAFAALSSSVTLAKLSLLDQAEMRKLVLELGGPQAQASYDANRFDVGRSILITAVRSIDGSEQWQPYALPFPRAGGAGEPAPAADRHYGYGPRDEVRHGFPLFIDPILRARVFAQLFPRQIHGEVAKRPEMAPGRYAFPICEGNPFPVTFLPGGEPALADDRCSSELASVRVH